MSYANRSFTGRICPGLYNADPPLSNCPRNRVNSISLYDRIGPLADSTVFYVDPALDRLTELASLSEARRVVEIGGGTGRYAERLLENVFPADAQYMDLDPSWRMRELARRRLAQWSARASIGSVDDPLPEPWRGTVDRYVATYVLNVLPCEAAIRERLDHAYRTLADNGLLFG